MVKKEVNVLIFFSLGSFFFSLISYKSTLRLEYIAIINFKTRV